jgi:hypothetical protein
MMVTVEDQRSPSDKRKAFLLGSVLNDVGSSIVDLLTYPIDLARFRSALSDSSLRPLLKTALGNNANLSSRVHESSASAIWTARSGGVVRSVVFEASATTREVVEVAEACPALQVANHLSYLFKLPFRLSFLYTLNSPLSDQLNSTNILSLFSFLSLFHSPLSSLVSSHFLPLISLLHPLVFSHLYSPLSSRPYLIKSLISRLPIYHLS